MYTTTGQETIMDAWEEQLSFNVVFIKCYLYFVYWLYERNLRVMHRDIPQIINSHWGWCLRLKHELIKHLCM